jgi:hypothetical protein
MDCDICCQSFTEKRQPKILSKCGHTFCADCIERMLHCSSSIAIQCPHCRCLTPPADVRTNFAILSSLQDKTTENARRDFSPDLACDTHPDSQLTLFCTTCFCFVCKHCFEVGSALHSTHHRVALEEGLKLVKDDIRMMREKVIEAQRLSEGDIQNERKKVEDASQALLRLGHQATNHFNTIMTRYKAELDRILGIFEECKYVCSTDLTRKLQQQVVLDGVFKSLPKTTDVVSLQSYSKRRGLLYAALEELRDFQPVTRALDALNITQETQRSANPFDLPNLTCLDPSSGNIFSFVPPQTLVSDSAIHEVSRIGSLHRSTSNDQLRR